MIKTKILNFGSINIDHVYNVENFACPGETILAKKYSKFCGGKGLNQSIALARAGVKVCHAGKIGTDGLWLVKYLKKNKVDCAEIAICQNAPTGHAIIQVNASGENNIVLYGGANWNISNQQIKTAFSNMRAGDFLLLQNEISSLGEIIETAHKKGMYIFFNIAPINDNIFNYPLELVSTLIVNKAEASALAGTENGASPKTVMEHLCKKYPKQNILMTLGKNGSVYYSAMNREIIRISAVRIEKVLDTTAAGDTFIGYFIAGLASGLPAKDAMRNAAKASALTVSRRGTAISIPWQSEFK